MLYVKIEDNVNRFRINICCQSDFFGFRPWQKISPATSAPLFELNCKCITDSEDDCLAYWLDSSTSMKTSIAYIALNGSESEVNHWGNESAVWENTATWFIQMN